VFAAFLVLLNKLYLVAGGAAAEAMEGVRVRVNAATRRGVFVERTNDVARSVGTDAVMRENRCDGQAGFDVLDFHC